MFVCFALFGKSFAGHVQVDRGMSLRDALESLSSGDVVTIDPGFYNTSDSCNITVFADNVVIRGSGTLETIIDCADQGRHVMLEGNNISLVNLRMQNGSPTVSDVSDTYGGCVLVRGASALLDGCHIENCFAPTSGGAIHAAQSTQVLTLQSVRIASSSAYYGGAVSVTPGTTLVMTGRSDAMLVMEGNNAAQGGAVFADNCVVEVIGSVQLTDNSAAQKGGAINVENSMLTISGDVTLAGDSVTNNGAMGGAIFAGDSTVVVEKGVELLYNEGPNGGTKACCLHLPSHLHAARCHSPPREQHHRC